MVSFLGQQFRIQEPQSAAIAHDGRFQNGTTGPNRKAFDRKRSDRLSAGAFFTKALLAAFLAVFLTMTALAADISDPIPETELPIVSKNWDVLFGIYGWYTFVDGDVGVGRTPTSPVGISTGDILGSVQGGATLRAEATFQQRWSAILDVIYANLGESTTTPLTGGKLDTEVIQLVIEGFLGHRVWQNGSTWAEVYAGGRYWDFDISMNGQGTIIGSFDLDRGDRWIDPVVGVRAFHDITDKWFIGIRADIGGFGVGSDFSWSAKPTLGYNFNPTWSVALQYNALYVDYDNGKSGTGRFDYDTITHGPLLGVVARF